MSNHTVQIGKTRFVCGLFWQSLSRPREIWKEAAQLAVNIDADLIVLRMDNAMAQAGYAHTREGARRGQHSLAAVISKTLAVEGAYYEGYQQPVHNWLCAFELPDGLWFYCAVRDANFLPNGDFAGSFEQVLERLQGDYAQGGWNVVIGDSALETYGFHNFSAKTLESLLPKRKDGQLHVRRWSALRPVKSAISTRQAVAAGTVGLLLFAGGAWYLRHQHQIQEQQRDQAIAAQRVRMNLAAGGNPDAQPWLRKPLPLDFARACMTQLDKVTPGGWQLELLECAAGRSDRTWGRNGSNVSYLHDQVPAAVISMTGDQATDSVPLPVPAKGKDILLPSAVVLRTLMAYCQPLGVVLKIGSAPVVPPPPVKNAEPAPKPEWQTHTLAAELATLAPETFATLISQPGVRLDRISWRGGHWSVEGVIYAK
ncbi:MAG: type 4b pilus protein PilO2 [Herminiimonas sp.]|nr:type 4b pilus protein PilO2 [Herminiimonas sp.]